MYTECIRQASGECITGECIRQASSECITGECIRQASGECIRRASSERITGECIRQALASECIGECITQASGYVLLVNVLDRHLVNVLVGVRVTAICLRLGVCGQTFTAVRLGLAATFRGLAARAGRRRG